MSKPDQEIDLLITLQMYESGNREWMKNIFKNNPIIKNLLFLTEQKNTIMETNENLQIQPQQAVELKIWIAPEIKELRTSYTNAGAGYEDDGADPNGIKNS